MNIYVGGRQISGAVTLMTGTTTYLAPIGFCIIARLQTTRMTTSSHMRQSRGMKSLPLHLKVQRRSMTEEAKENNLENGDGRR